MGKSRVADIAKVVGVHPNTIRNWTDKGLIDSKRDFRNWRIIPDKLKAIQTIQGLMSGEIKLDSHESSLKNR